MAGLPRALTRRRRACAGAGAPNEPRNVVRYHYIGPGVTIRPMHNKDPHQALTALLARLLDAAELGELLGRSRRWVYQQVRAGVLPALRLGTSLRFDPRDVADWLAARRTGSR